MRFYKKYMIYIKFKYIAYFLIILPVLSLSLGGCANYVKKTARPEKALFQSRKMVMAGLLKNYGDFKGMSGRLSILAKGKYFSFEQAGVYKYIKNKYIKFVIPDMYGNVLFYAKIINSGSYNKIIFFNPESKKPETINFNKKYSGKDLMYERLFKSFSIFLNIDSLDKIEYSKVFYNTAGGFFFEYRKANGSYYYICVGKKYLIKKITIVRRKRIIEVVHFNDYILKNKIQIPLRIDVNDYLYNISMKLSISRGSEVFHVNGFKEGVHEK